HRKRDHHEGREQEENDVDEWNDLDARFFRTPRCRDRRHVDEGVCFSDLSSSNSRCAAAFSMSCRAASSREFRKLKGSSAIIAMSSPNAVAMSASAMPPVIA